MAEWVLRGSSGEAGVGLVLGRGPAGSPGSPGPPPSASDGLFLEANPAVGLGLLDTCVKGSRTRPRWDLEELETFRRNGSYLE